MKFTLKDFLLKTAVCKSCDSTMNLSFHYSINDVRSAHHIYFNIIGKSVLALKLKNKYDKLKSSLITIDMVSHNYSRKNISNDINIEAQRTCTKCNKYCIYTKPFIFDKMLMPIEIRYIDLILYKKRSEYIIINNTDTHANNYCTISALPLGATWNMPVDVINTSRDDIFKKISRYEILQ